MRKYVAGIIRQNWQSYSLSGEPDGAEQSKADTCDSREIRRTTPRESSQTSGYLRLRVPLVLRTTNRRAPSPKHERYFPSLDDIVHRRSAIHSLTHTHTHKHTLSLSLSLALHTGCARNNFSGLFVFFNFVRNSIS